MARWIFPPEVTGPAPAEPDENDWCPACTYHWRDCVCADRVTPHPSEL
ncbi:hypothetical protein [Streptomyces sp. NPDC002537]